MRRPQRANSPWPAVFQQLDIAQPDVHRIAIVLHHVKCHQRQRAPGPKHRHFLLGLDRLLLCQRRQKESENPNCAQAHVPTGVSVLDL